MDGDTVRHLAGPVHLLVSCLIHESGATHAPAVSLSLEGCSARCRLTACQELVSRAGVSSLWRVLKVGSASTALLCQREHKCASCAYGLAGLEDTRQTGTRTRVEAGVALSRAGLLPPASSEYSNPHIQCISRSLLFASVVVQRSTVSPSWISLLSSHFPTFGKHVQTFASRAACPHAVSPWRIERAQPRLPLDEDSRQAGSREGG